MIKLKQNWMPKNTLLLKQLLVSTTSFITLPFFKPQPDGILKFFYSNYCEEPDGLIFDGTTSGYFSKIERVIDLKMLDKQVVFDIGCGDGTLLKWLRNKGVEFKKYIGVDFAYVPAIISEEAEFFLDDASNIDNHFEPYQTQTSFMTNSACYLDTSLLEQVLHNFRRRDKLIITEPSPNLFWDAHFNGVKPIYRKISEIEKILLFCGFEVLDKVQDYGIKIGSKFYFPLSYCLYAQKL